MCQVVQVITRCGTGQDPIRRDEHHCILLISKWFASNMIVTTSSPVWGYPLLCFNVGVDRIHLHGVRM